jgi:beta-barrel assembly-enhancing protease
MLRTAAARSGWRLACAWLLIASLATGCKSVIAPMLPAVTPPTEDEETRISREFRREAKKYFKFVNNPEVERYVERIGRRILAAAGPLAFDYRFFVVEEEQLNAFAVPGGSVYIFSAMIERAKSTDELAGVLGHEIIHIKARHMARSSGPDAVSLLSLLGLALAARSGTAAQAAGMIGQAVSATRQAAYSRSLEMESDTLGTRYMAAAGFNPNGTIAFLKMLDQERALNPIDVPTYVLSHPITQERIANAELVVKGLGPTQVRPDDPIAIKKVQIILRKKRSAQDDIVGEYQKLLQKSPHDPDLLHLLAFAQHLNGNFAAAQQNYRRAREIRPDYGPLYRDLGQLLGQTKEFSDARMAFDRAIALEPNEPLTFLYLGDMLETAGDLRGAAGAYLNAQNLAPLWDRPPQRLGLIYGKLDRLGDAYYYLARSHLLQDEDERAIADFERALKYIGAQTPRGQAISEELKTLKIRKR